MSEKLPKLQKWFYHLAHMFVSSVLAIVSYVALTESDLIGRLEGKFWPVVDRMTITDYDTHSYATGIFRYKGFATKYRDCDFEEVRWWLHEDGRYVREPRTLFQDKPQLRDVGVLEWNALVSALNPDKLLYSSYGEVVHDCPYIPWLTVTEFYRSPLP